MIHSKNYRLFNVLFLPLVGLNLAAIATFNLVVDPYGVIKNLTAPEENQFGFAESPDFPESPIEGPEVAEEIEPNPTTLEQRNKYRAERFKINLATLSITKIQPKTVFLGTSTALKLSTEHPALKVEPVYNLALPGAKMRDIKSYFDDTLANHPDLKEVVLSLDFFAFGGPKKSDNPTPEAQPEKPEEVTVVRTNKYSVTIPELIKINFSLDTLAASLRKITGSDLSLSPSGVQPNTEGQKKSKVLSARIDRPSSTRDKSKNRKKSKKARREEAKKLKQKEAKKSQKSEAKKSNQKPKKEVKLPVNQAVLKPLTDEQKKKIQLATPQVKPAALAVTLSKDSDRYRNFNRVMKMYLTEKSLYRDYNLSEEELANFKAIVDTCKQRNIKLTVFIAPVHAAQLELINRAGIWPEFENWKRQVASITPVWDFATYSDLTTEAIGDEMKHFVDSVHYRDEVGNLIMNRIYNYKLETVPANFGKVISPTNIEPHLEVVREQRLNWKDENLQIVQFVMELKKETDLINQQSKR